MSSPENVLKPVEEMTKAEKDQAKTELFNPSVRSMQKFAEELGSVVPVKADHCAVDAERLRFFVGQPMYIREHGQTVGWKGKEVGSWVYGNLNNLRSFFNFTPFLSKGIFRYSLACVSFEMPDRKDDGKVRRSLEEYAPMLEGLMPVEARWCAVDMADIKFFSEQPEFSAGPGKYPEWRGQEVGRWSRGSLSSLCSLFNVDPYVSKGLFRCSRALVRY